MTERITAAELASARQVLEHVQYREFAVRRTKRSMAASPTDSEPPRQSDLYPRDEDLGFDAGLRGGAGPLAAIQRDDSGTPDLA